MTTLLLEEEGSSQSTQQIQDDKTRQDLRIRRKIILEYLKSIGRRKDTSPKKKMEEVFYTWSPAYMTGPTFRYEVILPVDRAWELNPEIPWYLEQAEEEEEEDEEEYGILHDYVLDDLSVDYDSAKKFHEYLMSLRRQYERAKRSSK